MRLVIIGAGFAGMYAALSAARLRDIQGVSPEEFQIALVAPEPSRGPLDTASHMVISVAPGLPAQLTEA